MAMLDDDFFSKILLGMNTIITATSIAVRLCTKEYLENYHYQSARDLFGLQGPMSDWYPSIRFW